MATIPKELFRALRKKKLPKAPPQISILAVESLKQKRKSTRDLPRRPLARMAVKLHILGSLVWDYADTVLDLAALMSITPLKPLCRAIRELKLDYDRMRQSSLSDKDVEVERNLGILFEDICRNHFVKLECGLDTDHRFAELTSEYKMLSKAVYRTLTVIDAMRLFAADCDKWIERNGVFGHSILCEHFDSLAKLLPDFLGDGYSPHISARELTAKILYKELNDIEVNEQP
ncbi:MAG: hypothetical protein NC418_02400 [Muribaculaceae bacterium]|nr:hypothetical protein [Muribaculaceae bacterium]